MAFDAMPYHFFEIKMKENKNINKNIHHKSYIKVIIVKFTQDTRADIIFDAFASGGDGSAF